MAHFIAEKVSKFSSGELADKFKKKQILAMYRHEKSVYALGRITQALSDAEICFIPLKGAVISALYPKSYQRTSCDIDILVHENDLEKAQEAMGNAIFGLFDVVFGHDQTEKIIDLYDNKPLEMLADITPFITDVVAPRVQEAQQRIEDRYKQVKHHK
jgi:hypothetical protein